MTENQAKVSSGHERIPENDHPGPCDCIPPYPVWFCLGWFFPLPTAFCIGRKMKEKKPFLKYGIPGKLIFIRSPSDFSSLFYNVYLREMVFLSIRKQLSHMVSPYIFC